MMTREQLVQYVVGMIANNDHELIYQDNILACEVCHPGDRKRIRSFSEDLKRIYDSYWPDGYLRSSEFKALKEGRSPEYVAMLTKMWSSPVKRATKRKELDAALAEIMVSDRILDLVPGELEGLVPEIRAAIRKTGNPEQDRCT